MTADELDRIRLRADLMTLHAVAESAKLIIDESQLEVEPTQGYALFRDFTLKTEDASIHDDLRVMHSIGFQRHTRDKILKKRQRNLKACITYLVSSATRYTIDDLDSREGHGLIEIDAELGIGLPPSQTEVSDVAAMVLLTAKMFAQSRGLSISVNDWRNIYCIVTFLRDCKPHDLDDPPKVVQPPIP